MAETGRGCGVPLRKRGIWEGRHSGPDPESSVFEGRHSRGGGNPVLFLRRGHCEERKRRGNLVVRFVIPDLIRNPVSLVRLSLRIPHSAFRIVKARHAELVSASRRCFTSPA